MDRENENTFQIRTVNTKHSCGRVWSTRNVNSNIISDWYVAGFAADPNISVWNAKRKALEKVRGKITEQYAELESYIAEVKRSNSGTSIELICEDDEPDRLKRLETYKEHAAAFSCNYAGDGKYEGNPPKPEKMRRPPKPKNNPATIGTTLEKRREMVKAIEERQRRALSEASLNLTWTHEIEQSLEEEHPRSNHSGDNAQFEEAISTPNAPPGSQEGDDIDYWHREWVHDADDCPQNFVKCDYCPQFGHTKEDCPEFGLDIQREKNKAEESTKIFTTALDEIINTPVAPKVKQRVDSFTPAISTRAKRKWWRSESKEPILGDDIERKKASKTLLASNPK
ncbi:OLC1v1034478C1 [Oldenlandia corymbosa var. corymbosa]|uniref:OLC1v1034478C1 n=1 Tax=Oldenlandia corymbosa var. corymbosa TaxID=529605 RepID=A0AAV1CRE0_OLDCO|nr:OLC1v1034478C1 [Oldenlandia corymbosa var. corymbosa]